jgi:hypothetical protein
MDFFEPEIAESMCLVSQSAFREDGRACLANVERGAVPAGRLPVASTSTVLEASTGPFS